jgi:hypothetical protein
MGRGIARLWYHDNDHAIAVGSLPVGLTVEWAIVADPETFTAVDASLTGTLVEGPDFVYRGTVDGADIAAHLEDRGRYWLVVRVGTALRVVGRFQVRALRPANR